jgi:hypothetical protein
MHPLQFTSISPVIKKNKKYSKNGGVWRQENADKFIFLIGIVGGGVQLGPLGTAATNRPIVPAPGDYDDGQIGGMMIGREN